MAIARIILHVISIFLRMLAKIGFLWEIQLQLKEICYGKERLSVSPPKNPELLLPTGIIVENIRTGKTTAEKTILAYAERIREVNPLLNAISNDRFGEALEEARKIDEILKGDSNEEKEDLLKKPLLGVPITVKESIACRGMSHSSGIIDRKDLIAEADSTALENLRKAGAIPIAVTNCSELCMWWETTNNINGRTNNPHNTTRIAGGSSGGEGAIIASAGSVCGIGSDVGKEKRRSIKAYGIKKAR